MFEHFPDSRVISPPRYRLFNLRKIFLPIQRKIIKHVLQKERLTRYISHPLLYLSCKINIRSKYTFLFIFYTLTLRNIFHNNRKVNVNED